MRDSQHTWDDATRGRVAEWVRTWQETGRELERIRREDVASADPAAQIAALSGDMDFGVEPCLPKPWSGLVEQQALFARFRGLA